MEGPVLNDGSYYSSSYVVVGLRQIVRSFVWFHSIRMLLYPTKTSLPWILTC